MLDIGINRKNHPDWEKSDLGARDDWIVARVDDLLDEYNLKEATEIAEWEWEALK